VQYAAPPLLNELMQQGELDAVLNFWHYAARLQVDGLQTVISMPQVLQGLGIQPDLPLIGWVFSEKWAKEHSAAAKGFLSASYAAKQLLKTDDNEWQRLRPRMKAESDQVFKALREAYRAGIPACFGEQQQQAANTAFKILAETGGKALVGDLSSLPAGTFWQGFSLPACP
jgi:NitT/TauT family transport system substrate-binding protein